MKTRTIAGDIRRIRSLMRLGPEVGSCVIRRKDYGELLKLFDSIETKAKRMQDALKPVIDCITDDIVLTFDESSCAEGFDECMNAVGAVDEAKRIYNGEAK